MNKEVEAPIETSVIRCKNCGSPLFETGSHVQNNDNTESVICNNCGYIQQVTQFA